MFCFSFLKIIFSDIQVILTTYRFHTLCNFQNRNLVYLSDPSLMLFYLCLSMPHPWKSLLWTRVQKTRKVLGCISLYDVIANLNWKRRCKFHCACCQEKLLHWKVLPFGKIFVFWRLVFKLLQDYTWIAYTVDPINWYFACIFQETELTKKH